jgi:hypothetical protein
LSFCIEDTDMIPMSRYALMGGTVAAAVGIGYFMQASAPGEIRQTRPTGVQIASADPTAGADLLPQANATFKSGLTLPSRPMSEALGDNDSMDDTPRTESAPIQLATLAQSDTPAGGNEALVSSVSAPCEAEMTARVDAAAMVTLTIASCQPQTRVTLHHNGMMVQAMTDSEGALTTQLPALAEQAFYIAEFPNKEGAVAQVEVTSFSDYDRVVLQWRGESGLSLSAFEFGANWSEAGHVFALAPGAIEVTVRGDGGMLSKHGDFGLENSLRAEVYTYPHATSTRLGDISFSVDAEITEFNCEKEVSAQSLQVKGDGAIAVQELSLPLPECGSIGDYIVLKSMVENLKIVRN